MENYEENIIGNITADAEDEIWKLKKIIREAEDLPEDVREEIMQEIRRAEQKIHDSLEPKNKKR